MSEIKIVIIEDQDIVREGLEYLLNIEDDFLVIGGASNGSEGVKIVEELKPDIVLMDLHMPLMNGVIATQQIKNASPEIKVIILTTYEEINYVVDALSAGAEGYLLKANPSKELAAGIRLIYYGGTLIPQGIAKLIMSEFVELKQKISDPNPASEVGTRFNKVHRNYQLTERESQILELLGQGYNNFAIAQRLYLSMGTVKNYISSVYSKLEVTNRVEAVMKWRDAVDFKQH